VRSAVEKIVLSLPRPVPEVDPAGEHQPSRSSIMSRTMLAAVLRLLT